MKKLVGLLYSNKKDKFQGGGMFSKSDHAYGGYTEDQMIAEEKRKALAIEDQKKRLYSGSTTFGAENIMGTNAQGYNPYGMYDPYTQMPRSFVASTNMPYPINADNIENTVNNNMPSSGVTRQEGDTRPFLFNVDGTSPSPHLIGNQIRPKDISTIQTIRPEPGSNPVYIPTTPEIKKVITPSSGGDGGSKGDGSGSKGGDSGGSGDAPVKETYSGGRDKNDFNKAFADARASGLDVFEFGGKKFSTWREGEEKERKQAASSVNSTITPAKVQMPVQKKAEPIKMKAPVKKTTAKKAPAKKKKKDRGKPGTVFSRARDNFKKNREERRSKRKNRRDERKGVKKVVGAGKVNSEIKSGNTPKKEKKKEINKKNDKSAAIERGKI